jgi:hypothetical protein
MLGMLTTFLLQGTQTAAAVAEHRRTLAALKLLPEDQHEHDHLYGCLSILDSKAAALLQFDAILIATSTIVLSIRATGVDAGAVAVVVALVLATVSSAMTLLVINLFWTEASELGTPQQYLRHLLHVRDERTVRYRMAWLAAWMSLVVLVIGAIL